MTKKSSLLLETKVGHQVGHQDGHDSRGYYEQMVLRIEVNGAEMCHFVGYTRDVEVLEIEYSKTLLIT